MEATASVSEPNLTLWKDDDPDFLDTARLGWSRLFRRADGIEEVKELVHARNFQGIVDALTHGDQSEIPSAMLARDIRADQSADPR